MQNCNINPMTGYCTHHPMLSLLPDRQKLEETPAMSQSKNQNADSSRPPIDPDRIVNPSEDLVYKGGYSKDPREIVSNPAVAPQPYDMPTDIRSDLVRDEGEEEPN